MNESHIQRISDLTPLRSAPSLSAEQTSVLRAELAREMGAYSWFTVGVMAASAAEALRSLRQLETACGWEPMRLEGECKAEDGVFLKANQSSGMVRIRAEQGLGEGILISGHQQEQGVAGPTWGPFPLDLFTT
jgi:hypothetical protein